MPGGLLFTPGLGIRAAILTRDIHPHPTPLHTKSPIIFLLEDCPVTALVVERAIMNELPQARLLWARSVAEAVMRAEGLSIDIFLTDIQLPDGNGLDFLWQMTPLHPEARVMVMTASELPEYQAHSAALGALHFFEKPLHLPTLLGELRKALESTTVGGTQSDFSATLSKVTPADVIQLKCLMRATTLIEFHSDGTTGRIRFEDGEITDAAVGALHGPAAFAAIVGWKTGRVSEQPVTGPSQRTIHGSWQTLLMEAAQTLDEARAA